MNQILMTGNKGKVTVKMTTASIARFFAVAIVIFGMFFIGQGSYV